VQGILQTVHIYPAELSTPRTTAPARCAEILEIQVSADSLPEEVNLKKGDTVIIEGVIHDSNVSTDLRLSGVNAAYHYREGGKDRTVFLVRLDDARISAMENPPAVPQNE
jgi:hypothetical protein